MLQASKEEVSLPLTQPIMLLKVGQVLLLMRFLLTGPGEGKSLLICHFSSRKLCHSEYWTTWLPLHVPCCPFPSWSLSRSRAHWSTWLHSRPHQESGERSMVGAGRGGGGMCRDALWGLVDEVENLENWAPALHFVAENAEGLGATVTFSKAAPRLPGWSSSTSYCLRTAPSMPGPQSCPPPCNQWLRLWKDGERVPLPPCGPLTAGVAVGVWSC